MRLIVLFGFLFSTATYAAQAPDQFSFVFKTTKGEMNFDCPSGWAPLGGQRLYDLISAGYYTNIAFFRVISGFVAQFGISGDPAVSAKWNSPIKDDPVKASNVAGTLSFATDGPDTRTAQLFINLVDNARLDALGFSPVCKTDAAGLDVAKKLYAGYGEATSGGGTGPEQGMIYDQGNTYLKLFPQLDYVLSTTLK